MDENGDAKEKLEEILLKIRDYVTDDVLARYTELANEWISSEIRMDQFDRRGKRLNVPVDVHTDIILEIGEKFNLSFENPKDRLGKKKSRKRKSQGSSLTFSNTPTKMEFLDTIMEPEYQVPTTSQEVVTVDQIINAAMEEEPPRVKSLSNAEKLTAAISEMMFANGDSQLPNNGCVIYVQKFLKEQLLLIINRANEAAKARKEDQFKFKDLLKNFRGHPDFACRLVKYIADRSLLSSFSTAFSEDSEMSIDVPTGQSSMVNEICAVFKKFDQDGSFYSLIQNALEPDYVDPVKQARQTRLVNIGNQMDSGIYGSFSQARRRRLCYSGKGGISKPFQEWIGKIRFDTHSLIIVNFLASEIVVKLVEGALSERANDPNCNGTTFKSYENALKLRHYKNALHRNLEYQASKDLLFGSLPNV